MNLPPSEIFLPCAEDLGKRRDYRTLQQLLQLIRDNDYTDSQLYDDTIEACILQTGPDVEQVKTIGRNFGYYIRFFFFS